MKYVPPLGSTDQDAGYVNRVGAMKGSPVPAAAIEHPMREIHNTIRAAGLTPSGDVLNQLALAIQALILKAAQTPYEIGQYYPFEDEMPRESFVPLLGGVVSNISRYPKMIEYLESSYGQARLVTQAQYDALHIASSLFNVDTGNTFTLEADLPIEAEGWNIGLIAGPSGSGKSSLGAALLKHGYALADGGQWPRNAPIIDAINPAGNWQKITAALAAVGLGTVPAWLRPYNILSTGEKFRAELARLISEAPEKVVIDEFTSVVDRQIARVGAASFARAWRKTGGKAVCLSCHFDIMEWLEPDWIFNTQTGTLEWTRGRLRRPGIPLEIRETNAAYWPHFAPHHYLKAPLPVAATYYVGFVGAEPVAHIAISPRPGLKEARACRIVVMPEWQGIGVGMAFLHEVCDLWRRGENRFRIPMRTLVNTSHPGLASALRRHPQWTQITADLHGADKTRSKAALTRTATRQGWYNKTPTGYGGHFRAVQCFRYLGEEAPALKEARKAENAPGSTQSPPAGPKAVTDEKTP
ncbi:conserved hypothetical protein [uncultured delta proteobacterium]|uniref:N-acetyltransferase domain-containing protein n=1 Tax=uncultured delta proteobacterium TaxID=34034 RepID=A0A212JEV0_9DELT|nr:conserved hypothetical protein [uncultured delta proteobacterium]